MRKRKEKSLDEPLYNNPRLLETAGSPLYPMFEKHWGFSMLVDESSDLRIRSTYKSGEPKTYGIAYRESKPNENWTWFITRVETKQWDDENKRWEYLFVEDKWEMEIMLHRHRHPDENAERHIFCTVYTSEPTMVQIIKDHQKGLNTRYEKERTWYRESEGHMYKYGYSCNFPKYYKMSYNLFRTITDLDNAYLSDCGMYDLVCEIKGEDGKYVFGMPKSGEQMPMAFVRKSGRLYPLGVETAYVFAKETVYRISNSDMHFVERRLPNAGLVMEGYEMNPVSALIDGYNEVLTGTFRKMLYSLKHRKMFKYYNRFFEKLRGLNTLQKAELGDGKSLSLQDARSQGYCLPGIWAFLHKHKVFENEMAECDYFENTPSSWTLIANQHINQKFHFSVERLKELSKNNLFARIIGVDSNTANKKAQESFRGYVFSKLMVINE
jgi:hypothetical protein